MNARTHRLARTCTHTHKPVAYEGNQGNETEEKFFLKEKGFQGRFKRADRGRMADRNRDNWSLVRERALTTELSSEGWYSEHNVKP